MPLFKTESVSKRIQKVRSPNFNLFVIQQDNFLNNKSLFIPVDEIDDWHILNMVGIFDASKARVTIQN